VSAIFLSYRRSDSADRVNRIYRWLVNHGVPEAEIFFDTSRDSIPPRAEFPDKIRLTATDACCTLVVIGPHWLDHRRRRRFSKRSLWRQGDWVRTEIEIALLKLGRTLPILLDQTSMPSEGKLPPSIRALSAIQGKRLRVGEADFEEDMLRIAAGMAGALDGILHWDADQRHFIYIPKGRAAYLRALEARFAIMDLPITPDVQLPAETVYQPLRLLKDPTLPAEHLPDENRSDDWRDSDNADVQGEDAEGEDAEADDERSRVRADTPEQALALSPTRRMVVLGDPGSGKTTMLYQLLLGAARRAQYDATAPLPIVLSLPALARSGQWTKETLPQFMKDTLEGMNQSLPDVQTPTDFAQLLTREIERGAAFLCLDGLDEVTPSQRRGILGWIATLAPPVSSAAIIVGSRFTDYREGDLPHEHYTEWELESLTLETRSALADALIPQLCQALYPDRPFSDALNATQLIEHIGKGPAVSWWGDNPLLLTLAAFAFVKRGGSLPRRRVELYDDVVKSLIEVRLKRDGLYTDFTLRNTYDLLTAVSLYVFTHVGQVFTVKNLTDALRANADSLLISGEEETNRQYLRVIRSGLLEPQASHTYKFRHPTFQEFLAGAELAALLAESAGRDPAGLRRKRAWALIDEKSVMSRWSEPLAMMAGVLVTQYGAAGDRAAARWIGGLSERQASPEGDPGYLALGLALHALRDTVGTTSSELQQAQERCLTIWADAYAEAARKVRRVLRSRLLRLMHDIADFTGPDGGITIVMERLVQQLSDPDERVRKRAVRALGALGERTPIEPLLQALNDQSGRVRGVTVTVLSKVKVRERVPIEPLLQMLDNPYGGIRQAALALLARLGERTPVEPLLHALSDPSAAVRWAAAIALGRLGERAPIEPLEQAFRDHAWRVRSAVATAVGALGERAPIALLEQALRDPDRSVRRAAATALGRLGGYAPLEPLVQALHDDDRGVRAAAVKAVGALGERAPARLLVPMLYDSAEAVRQATVRALSNMGDQVPAAQLQQALRNPNDDVRAAAEAVVGKLEKQAPVEALRHMSRNAGSDPSNGIRYAAVAVLAGLEEQAPLEPLFQAFRDRSWRVRQIAIEALGNLRQRAPIAVLIEALRDGVWQVRRAAVMSLGRLEARAPVEPLIKALYDEKREVREAAVEVLSDLRDWVSVEPLINALHDTNTSLRQAAATVLGRLDERAPVESLVQALHDRNEYVRQAAVEALGNLADRAPIEPLAAALHDDNAYTRQAAAEALGRLGHRIPIEPLIRALGDPDLQVRRAAVEALGKVGERMPVATVIAALRDSKAEVRAAATTALGKLGVRAPIEPLVQALRTIIADVREAAVAALVNLGHRVPIERISRILEDSPYWSRQAAVQVLGQLGERAPIEPLVQALNSPDWQVRQAAAGALSRLGERAPIEPLVQALNDPVWLVRQATVQALSRLRDNAPIEPLVAALNDPDNAVRQAAAEALGRWREEAPAVALAQMLGDPNESVRQAAVAALGQMGSQAPIDPLVAALSDPNESVRQAAVAALGQLGERTPIKPLLQAMQDVDNTVSRIACELARRCAPDELERVAVDAARILLGTALTPEDVPAFGALWQVQIARDIGEVGLSTPEVITKLAVMLDWAHWRVKVAAAETLGKLKRHVPLATIDRLRSLRNDANEPQVVRDACDDALAEILAFDPMEDVL